MVVADLGNGCECGFHVAQPAHPRRNDQRLALAGNVFDVRDIRNLARGDLIGGNAEIIEQVHTAVIESRRQEINPAIAACIKQMSMRSFIELQLAKHLQLRLFRTRRAELIASFLPFGGHHLVSAKSLKLDGVGSSLCGRIDELFRQTEISIVVDPSLSNQKTR